VVLEPQTTNHKPTIVELGADLLNLTRLQLLITLSAPIFFFVLYWVFAFLDYWIAAVLSAMALSFSTYGSTSHDLVHENLKISKTLNTVLLSFTEAICFRSGHAYKLSHLYHHKRYPHEDDVEGSAARMTFFRSIVEGVIFQFKIYRWSLTRPEKSKYHFLVLAEGFIILLLVLFCFFSLRSTYIPFVYLCLMISGSWIIPLVTSYAVHTPHGSNELQQTRLFRGKFFSIIAFDHLYHLEHHLYPMVPHKNWPKLAERLDNYFKKEGVKPMEFKI
jgi:beta-carotene hydroxylase